MNTSVRRFTPVLAVLALVASACGGTASGPTAQPSPTPAPTPFPRVVLGTGTFNDEAPNPGSSATNSFFTIPTQAGRMDVRAAWGTPALVRISIYNATCTATRLDAGQCETVLGSVAGRATPAVLTDVGVPDGTITIRLENLGVGPTGAGTWEVGLIKY